MVNQERLPEYDAPPLVEVVVGVQFRELEGFNLTHPGLFYSQICDRYPNVSLKPPIVPQTEVFSGSEVEIQKLQQTAPRFWFSDKTKNGLVQFQPDRFHYNWRKIKEDDDYPRFKNISSSFTDLFGEFCQFISDDPKLEKLSLNHWEITYVNHFPVGEVWSKMHDLPELFPVFQWSQLKDYLSDPEEAKLEFRYAYPKHLGRLYISFESCFFRNDNKKLIRMNLTTRGKLKSNDTDELHSKLELGHGWIVNGFTDFTSQKAHNYWKRKV